MHFNWKIAIPVVLLLLVVGLVVATNRGQRSEQAMQAATATIPAMGQDVPSDSSVDAALKTPPPAATGNIDDITASLEQELTAEELISEQSNADASALTGSQNELTNLTNIYDGTQF